MTETIKKINGPASLKFLKNLKEPLSYYFYDLMKQYGEVVDCGFNIYLVSHPGFARHILNNDIRKYEKSDLISKRMHSLLGNGILCSNCENWLAQRKLLHHLFTRESVKEMMGGVLEVIRKFISGWELKAMAGENIELVEEFSRLSLLISAKSFLNADITDRARELSQILDAAGRVIVDRNPVTIPPWIPTPGNLRVRKMKHRVDEILAECTQSNGESKTLQSNIGSVVASSMTGELKKDEFRTLLFSGSSTISAALSSFWYLMGRNSGYLKELYSLLEKKTYEPLMSLDFEVEWPFLVNLIYESFRLFPPAYVIWRKCIKDDEFDGYVIPSGGTIIISIFNIHRHPDFWENPELFDPSRFDKSKTGNRQLQQFIPFGWGPRKCIGDSFAMRVLPMVILEMIRKFQIRVHSDKEIRFRLAPGILPEKLEAMIDLK